MGVVQKDSFRMMVISYLGMLLGYLNKAVLFLLILSTEEIGLISLLVSIGVLFAQFSNMGVIYTIWKFFPFFRNPEKRNHGFLPMTLIITTLGVILCSSILLIFKEQIEATYIEKSALFVDYYFWVIPIGIAHVFFLVFQVYLQALYKSIIPVFANDLVFRLVLTILLFLTWLGVISFHELVIYHSLSFAIPTLILVSYLKRINELNLSISSINISSRFRKILVKFSLYVYINTLGGLLIRSLDLLMIAQFVGLEATGVYAIVIFMTSALQIPYNSIIRVSSPLVADHWKSRSFDDMRELYTKVSSVSLLIGLGAFLVVWLNIDVLFTFFKPEFQEGIWVFFFLMMGRLLDMFFGLNGSIFTTSKKYKYEIYFTISLILIVYFLNLWFIPIWGITGAAISTSIGLFVYNLGRLIFVWYVFKMHPFTRNQFIVIALGILTMIAGSILNTVLDNQWLQVGLDLLLIAVIFALPIYVFYLEKESIDYFHKALTFIRGKLNRSSKK